MRRLIVVLMAVVACLAASAQPGPTVCYASGKDEFTSVGPPAEYLRYKALKASARTQSTNIEVTYEGFTTEAQAAFQEAVNIWESILETPVTIRIHARWTPLAAGVLGSASPGQYVNNFDGAPMQGVWYPIALAEKIAGKDINAPSEYDIDAAFNSAQASWHFGLMGSDPPQGKYDLVTIVLHEIGHGLGITHGYDIANNQAVIPSYYGGMPVVYETNIITATSENYVSSYTPPSSALGSAITSKLYYSSPLVKSKNSNQDAVLYTPATYSAGSSIAHLDELTYLAGTVNSLMTPAIGSAERMLDPGPIVLAILKQMGWTNTELEHTPITDTENTTGPYHVVVHVKSDPGYDQSTVKLTYTPSGASPNTITMTATANADEYKADIPGGASDYRYSISVSTNDLKTSTIPAPLVQPGHSPTANVYSFHAGPDNKLPVIQHQKKEFATNVDDFSIEATITDNIGVNNAAVQWQVNSVPMPDEVMTLVTPGESVYQAVISKSNYQIGDTIKYRIRAEDSSSAHNVAFNPTSTDYNKVVVTGLGEPQNSYQTNFNDGTSRNDFFGNGFSFPASPGFDEHIQFGSPYASPGVEGQHLDFVCNLKIPIKVASKEATIKFDEIVLVEPGKDGSVWPSEDFYDYVVVEGSTDGTTWIAIADGYDARYNKVWVDLWNENINDAGNSTSAAGPSLYRSHTFNLLNKFKAGDEVAIRFRLYSDPFSNGWGWAIDNLRIQIDENPPSIRHQHVDFVTDTAKYIVLNMKVDDDSGVKQVFVDYKLNGGSVTTQEIIVNPALDKYTSKIDLVSLAAKAGDMIQYKIRAIDSLGNVGSFPTNDFIATARISLTSSVDQEYYTDLTGNFFVLNTIESGFESNHPYDPGMGIDGNSDFSLVTKKPIKVSATNPWIYYEEMALIEYNGSGVKDYVVVEGSKDGLTWKQLVAPYAANAFADWKSIYDAGGVPTAQSTFPQRMFDITASGDFKKGDVILVRFRLHSDSTTTGKGWYVFHLNIQGVVTGLEPQIANEIVTAWPNPLAGDALYLKLALPGPSDVNVEILNMQGQLLSRDQFSALAGDFQREYNVSDWSSGLYLIKVKSVFGTSAAKLIKLK